MKIDALTIYLWQAVDQVRDFLGAPAFGFIPSLMIVIGIIALILPLMVDEDDNIQPDACRRIGAFLVKIGLITLFTVNLLHALIPSSKTIAMMVVIPSIAESRVIQQDVPDLYDAAVRALKENLSVKENQTEERKENQ